MVLMEASSVTNYARVKHQEALKTEKLAGTEGIAEKQIADERRMVAQKCLVGAVDFSRMLSRVQDLQADCVQLENKCVQRVTFLDK